MSSPSRQPPPPAARPRPVKASPWPFVGMAGMVATFFLYLASGFVAPVWAVVLLMAVWVVLFALACRWWTPHPRRLLLLAVVAVVVWFAAVIAGGLLLDWGRIAP